MGTQLLLPKKGAEPPNFRSMSIVAKRLDGSRCHLVSWRLALAQATLCKMASAQATLCSVETQLPLPWKGGTAAPPQFSVHVSCGQTAGWINIPLGTEVGLGSDHIVLDEDPAPPKGAQPPIFGPCLLWPKGRPSQLLLSTCYVFFCIIVPFSLLVHVWFCCIRFSFVSTVLSD